VIIKKWPDMGIDFQLQGLTQHFPESHFEGELESDTAYEGRASVIRLFE